MERFSASIDRFFGHRWSPLFAFLVLALVMVYFFNSEVSNIRTAQHGTNTALTRITKIDTSRVKSQIANCERLDAILASNNETGQAQYRFELTTTNYLSTFLLASPDKLFNAGTLKVINRLRSEAADATWTPLVSCTNPSSSYLIPSPVHFSVRMPTPADLPAGTTL